MSLIAVQLPKSAEPKPTGAFGFPAGKRVDSTLLAINGLAIPLRGAFTWGYKSGVSPQQVSVSLSNEYANKLVEVVNAQGGKVVIDCKTNSIENVAIPMGPYSGLSLLPRSPDTHVHDIITITDDRWRWPNKNVYRTYNLLRKADDKFAAPVTFAGVLKLTEAKRYFVPWTIRQDENGQPVAPFTALDIVVDILTNFLGYDASKINLDRAQKSNYVPPNIVLVGQKAHSVISRFLSDSDNNLYIEDDGSITIYAENIPFGEKEFDKHLRPALRGKVEGQLWIQDRQNIRPTNIYESFEKEEEYLLTFKDASESSTSSGSERPAESTVEALAQLASKRVYVRNITTTVVDNQVGNLPAGAIVTIEKALEAFGQEYGSAPITLDEFRENYGIAAPAVFALVLQDPTDDALLDPKAITVWSRIVGDYRRKFQIPHHVTQFIKDANNVLVEIVDPETGKRKPSEVFSTVSWVVNVQARINKKRASGITLDSFGNLSEDGKYKPIPATISDIDPETGIFELIGLDDLNQPGAITDIILGRPVSEDAFFEDTFAEGETPLTRDSLIGAHGLKADWEMSAVASITLLPKSADSMYWVDSPAPAPVKPGNGPPVEIHIGYDTARFALAGHDAYRTGASGFINKALIEAIAGQEGPKRWVTFSDQLIGSVRFAISEESKKLRPTGPVSEVTFTVSTNGSVRMAFDARPISEGRDIRNTLEKEMLEAIFRQVHFETPTGTR